jgi:hypothetical protein
MNHEATVSLFSKNTRTLTKAQLQAALDIGSRLCHPSLTARSKFIGQRIIKAVTAELAERYPNPDQWGTR